MTHWPNSTEKYLKSNFPTLLLIAGTGRNSGKTTLACNIIHNFTFHKPVAIKISPHFHMGASGLDIITQNKGYNIYRENSSTSGKDSARMLKAGAEAVYYMEVLDNNLLEAFQYLMKKIPNNVPVVCESPALRKFINPGIFLIADSPYTLNKKKDVLGWKDRADYFLNSDIDDPEKLSELLHFNSLGWSMNHKKG